MMLVEINLLPKKEQKNIANYLIASIILLILVVGGLFLFVQLESTKGKLNSLQNQLETTKALRTIEEEKLEKFETSSSVNDLERTIQFTEELQVKTVPLVRQITELLPERGFLQNLSYLYDGSVTITVQFDTSREAAYYLKALTETNTFSEASLLSLSTLSTFSQAEITERTELPNQDYMPRYIAQYQLMINKEVIKAEQKEGE